MKFQKHSQQCAGLSVDYRKHFILAVPRNIAQSEDFDALRAPVRHSRWLVGGTIR